MKSSDPSASPVMPAPPASDAELLPSISSLLQRGANALYILDERNFFLSSIRSFIVQDEHGRVVYRIECRFSYFGNQIRFQDSAGHEVAVVSEIFPSFWPLPRYEFYRNGKKTGRIGVDGKLRMLGPNGHAIAAKSWSDFRSWCYGGTDDAASFRVELADTDDPMEVLAVMLITPYVTYRGIGTTVNGSWLWWAVAFAGIIIYLEHC